MPTPLPVRVTGTPLPVKITGTAVPVVLKNSLPLPVVNTGPPDAIAIYTLAAAVATLGVSVVAAVFAMRSIHFSKKDLALTVEQALKADAARTKIPNLELTAYDPASAYAQVSTSLNVVGNADPMTFVLELHIKNIGVRDATKLRVAVRASDGLILKWSARDSNTQNLSSTEKASLVALAGEFFLAPTEKAFMRCWDVDGYVGMHTLWWQVTAAEGAWPCEVTDPLEKWERLTVTMSLAKGVKAE
jgi:hypothetical protein